MSVSVIGIIFIMEKPGFINNTKLKSLVLLQTCLLVKLIFLILGRMQHLCLNAYTALNNFRGLYVVMV